VETFFLKIIWAVLRIDFRKKVREQQSFVITQAKTSGLDYDGSSSDGEK
jgi:hypothetical protein